MSGRLPFCIRIGKDDPIELPPAVERIARNSGVFKMIENGLELASVAYDDGCEPTEAVFVFGDDQVVRFKAGKPNNWG